MREDWVECKLGNLLSVSSGKGLSASKMEVGSFPVYGGNGISGFHSKYIFEEIKLIIGRVGAKCGCVHITQPNAWVTDNALVVNFYFDNPNLKFFKLLLEIENLNKLSNSTAQPVISGAKIHDFNIFLPPLPEQRAIVKKLESLFSSLDAGVADFKKAQQQLKIYRQAVLKKAFEGELTKEWRNKENFLLSSHQLLTLLNEEREAFYLAQVKDWEREIKEWRGNDCIGKKPTRPSKFSKPDLPTSEQEANKWEIPHNWLWTQVGDTCFVTKLAGFEYTEYVKYVENGDLPVLKAENVGSLGFKPTEYSKVESDSVSMLKRSYLSGGELLIVFVGAGTGNVGLVPSNQKFFLGPNIGMARPYFTLNGKYLEYFYQCLLGKKLLIATVKAVAQPSLSMGSIRQAPFIMCSIEEQDQIVKEIDSRLSVCDSMMENIKAGLLKSEALRQSILKKAFEGKLLTAQELAECRKASDYEPASLLLKRIKAEQKEAKPEKK